MRLFFHNRRDDSTERQQHTNYLAQRMAPLIRALLLLAVPMYLFAAIARSLIGISPIPWPIRILVALPLLLVALAARRAQGPRPLRLLALACLLWLEVGINLSDVGHAVGQPWIIPGLLLPVATSMIWLTRLDFAVAMVVCALGPLPMLLTAGIDHGLIAQYVVVMSIAIMVAAAMRTFLARTLLEQFRLERELRDQANTDGLTGVLLRNHFLELARAALLRQSQAQRTACMLYLDVDHFKRINDDHGHAAGDAALVALAGILRAQSRPLDLIGRVGGEEFALLLPDLDQQQAGRRAEQLRLAVRTIPRSGGGCLTVSIGIAECAPDGCDDVDTLLARADQAMRRAKHAGRDRTFST